MGDVEARPTAREADHARVAEHPDIDRTVGIERHCRTIGELESADLADAG